MISITKIQNSVFSSNTFILRSDLYKGICLIDCGDTDKIFNKLEKDEYIDCVLLTHTHSDHIYGLKSLLEKFPNAKIFTNEYGKLALKSPKMNISRYHDEYPDVEIETNNVSLIKSGDILQIFEESVTITETPGHDPSCITFCFDKYIFTGDSYIPGVKVHTAFPKGNKIQAEESLIKIKTLLNGKIICPGHGDIIKQ